MSLKKTFHLILPELLQKYVSELDTLWNTKFREKSELYSAHSQFMHLCEEKRQETRQKLGTKHQMDKYLDFNCIKAIFQVTVLQLYHSYINLPSNWITNSTFLQYFIKSTTNLWTWERFLCVKYKNPFCSFSLRDYIIHIFCGMILAKFSSGYPRDLLLKVFRQNQGRGVADMHASVFLFFIY